MPEGSGTCKDRTYTETEVKQMLSEKESECCRRIEEAYHDSKGYRLKYIAAIRFIHELTNID